MSAVRGVSRECIVMLALRVRRSLWRRGFPLDATISTTDDVPVNHRGDVEKAALDEAHTASAECSRSRDLYLALQQASTNRAVFPSCSIFATTEFAPKMKIPFVCNLLSHYLHFYKLCYLKNFFLANPSSVLNIPALHRPEWDILLTFYILCFLV